jgi:riboflavin biosynthesis pyrimidine reductase
MRKVILFVDTSRDGFMAGPNGELDWMVNDDELDREFTTDLREQADTILTGKRRRTRTAPHADQVRRRGPRALARVAARRSDSAGSRRVETVTRTAGPERRR